MEKGELNLLIKDTFIKNTITYNEYHLKKILDYNLSVDSLKKILLIIKNSLDFFNIELQKYDTNLAFYFDIYFRASELQYDKLNTKRTNEKWNLEDVVIKYKDFLKEKFERKNGIMRINKISIELNVSSERIISELKKINNISYNKSSKLDELEINHLKTVFRKDKEFKSLSNEKEKYFFCEIDENFNFYEKEKIEYKSLYIEHRELFKNIGELLEKKNKYWALNNDEIKVIQKLKYQKIELIQKEINSLRFENERNQGYHNIDIDPHEKFRWGSLSGEEAHIGYWNTD